MDEEILKIHSIELDKSKAFRWEIVLKDETGYPLERIPVKESEADVTFACAVTNWLSECDKMNQPRKGKSHGNT